MSEYKFEMEFEDQQVAREIEIWCDMLGDEKPPEIASLRKDQSHGTLQSADWHFLEIVIAAVTIAGAAGAKKVGEMAVAWFAKALRDRLAIANDTSKEKKSDAREVPVVKVTIREITIDVTPQTTNKEIDSFAHLVDRESRKSED